MRRAAELFTFDERTSASPFVTGTWATRSEPAESFISVAAYQSEIVVTRQAGTVGVTVRGPETRATEAPIPQDAEFFGIRFGLGTFMPSLAPPGLVDRATTLPVTSGRSFRLEGSDWELPGPDTADAFVERLARAGLLVHDPLVAEALQGPVAGLSTRSVERRVVRATGLTRGAIRQIRRAEEAVELLGRGVAPAEVVRRAGYADQPHLTRSLRRFVGQTPTQVASSG